MTLLSVWLTLVLFIGSQAIDAQLSESLLKQFESNVFEYVNYIASTTQTIVDESNDSITSTIKNAGNVTAAILEAYNTVYNFHTYVQSEYNTDVLFTQVPESILDYISCDSIGVMRAEQLFYAANTDIGLAMGSTTNTINSNLKIMYSVFANIHNTLIGAGVGDVAVAEIFEQEIADTWKTLATVIVGIYNDRLNQLKKQIDSLIANTNCYEIYQ